MRATTVFSTLALGAVLTFGGVMLAPIAFAQTNGDTQAVASQRQWLSLPQIQVILESAGFRNIDKIEREDHDYEVEALDSEGRRVELNVDPHSGEVTGIEIKNRKRDERTMNGARSDSTRFRPAARSS